jgi:hypothetical protein
LRRGEAVGDLEQPTDQAAGIRKQVFESQRPQEQEDGANSTYRTGREESRSHG